MKKIYVTLFAFAAINQMNAQLTLTKAANEPVSGDMNTLRGYDSTTAVPKNTGTGLTWNFTSMTPLSFTETTTYTTSSSTPQGSLFPSCNLAAMRGGSQTEYHVTSGANWEYGGSYDSGGPTVTSLTNTAIFAAWPISLGSSNSDNLSGTETTGTVAGTWSGAISYSATGSGTVVMPGGQTYTNCLQVVMNISLTTTQGTASTTELSKQYMYFASGRKFPIVEYSYKTQTTGTVVSKSFDAHVDNTIPPLGVKENFLSGEVSVYPNPAKDILNVSVNGKPASSVEVIDLTGKTVMSLSNISHLNVSSLKPSLYLVRIKEGEASVTKRIAIER